MSGPRSLSSNYLTLIIPSWLSTNPTNALFRAKHREKARESNIGARARAPHRRQVVEAASSRLQPPPPRSWPCPLAPIRAALLPSRPRAPSGGAKAVVGLAPARGGPLWDVHPRGCRRRVPADYSGRDAAACNCWLWWWWGWWWWMPAQRPLRESGVRIGPLAGPGGGWGAAAAPARGGGPLVVVGVAVPWPTDPAKPCPPPPPRGSSAGARREDLW